MRGASQGRCSDLATIDALSAGDFKLAESEMDFCLPISDGEAALPGLTRGGYCEYCAAA
ncbi:MAG: hypothetical protein ACR5LD_02145 [Symbiopectobacterium sp.]